MQIQFPRRVQLGFRPWYGLTLRQLGYLVVAGVVAGAIVLFGPAEGGGLLTRVVIGLAIILVGVALAFFRRDGLTAEQWVLTQIKFVLRPHKRVWTRGGSGSPRDQIAEILIDQTPSGMDGTANDPAGFEGPVSRARLLHPNAQSTSASPVIILLDMAMLLSLFSLGIYLSRGGLQEIQAWFLTSWGR